MMPRLGRATGNPFGGSICCLLHRPLLHGADRTQVSPPVAQRVFGIASGHEDVNGHDQLRLDPMMAILAVKLEACQPNCAPVRRQEHAEPARAQPARGRRVSQDQS
jgi:hypothetical protein